MTRIMTITSGLPGTGKTQLAINIALELVRRGYQAGVFYARDKATPIERLLQVQQPVNMLRRADDPRERGLLRSGYQGIDIVTCGTPLREWPTVGDDQRDRCIQEMDVQDGYDDFLIDTSGMDVRTLLACCRASGIVVLVVTPEPQSHAEAFALIRVLQLNGFSGLFRLIVNKVSYLADADNIHDLLYRQVSSRLGLEIPLLGVVPRDERLRLAQRARQAFSSVFPESEAVGGVIDAANALGEIPGECFSGPRTLSALWHTLIDIIQLPVTLSGDVLLDDAVETSQHAEPLPEAPVAVEHNETGLLQFQGNLASLGTLRSDLQGDLQVLLEDLHAFVETTELDSRILREASDEPLQRDQMINLVSRLLVMVDAAYPKQTFCFQVTDTLVTRPDTAWLQPGRYLKYVFHMMRSELPDSVHILLLNVPAITMTTATGGGTLYELINAVRHCCLNIVSDPQEGVRMQLWLNNEPQQEAQSWLPKRAPAR